MLVTPNAWYLFLVRIKYFTIRIHEINITSSITLSSITRCKTKVDLSEVRLTAPSLLLELIEAKEDTSVQKIESFLET